MSYQFYKLLHFIGLFTAFMSLAVPCLHAATGGTKLNFPHRKLVAITHGLSIVVVLVAGFGLMARAEYKFSEHPWLYLKLVYWLILGIFPALIWRSKIPGKALFWSLIALGALASYTVIYKLAL